MSVVEFPALLQSFFIDRLLRQLQASPHTIASYRSTFRLLLDFAQKRLGTQPSRLVMTHLDAAFLSQFLDYVENERKCSARTRNVRLAALHSFFRYVALSEPGHALHCQRVLAIPSRRFERRVVEFLVDNEVDALVGVPDLSNWLGRRDRALLLLAVQTGLRVSELTALRWQDVSLTTGAHVRCNGKGSKLRCTPLRPDVVKVLLAWARECPMATNTPVFPSSRGGYLSHDAVENLVAKHIAAARQRCFTLAGKRITPHSLRHTAAMTLLLSGVDRSVIALWLGHESYETTQSYLHANLALKEEALARTTSSKPKRGRYRADDKLLAFLDNL